MSCKSPLTSHIYTENTLLVHGRSMNDLVAALLKLGQLLLFFCDFEKVCMKCENLSNYVNLTKYLLCGSWAPVGVPFFPQHHLCITGAVTDHKAKFPFTVLQKNVKFCWVIYFMAENLIVTLDIVYLGQFILLENTVHSSLTLLLMPSQRGHCGGCGNKILNLFV